jgi:hypothetical protein
MKKAILNLWKDNKYFAVYGILFNSFLLNLLLSLAIAVFVIGHYIYTICLQSQFAL